MRSRQLYPLEELRPVALALRAQADHPINPRIDAVLQQIDASRAATLSVRLKTRLDATRTPHERALTFLLQFLVGLQRAPEQIQQVAPERLVRLFDHFEAERQRRRHDDRTKRSGRSCHPGHVHQGRWLCLSCRRVNAHAAECGRNATDHVPLPIGARVPRHDASRMRWHQFGRAMERLGTPPAQRIARTFP